MITKRTFEINICYQTLALVMQITTFTTVRGSFVTILINSIEFFSAHVEIYVIILLSNILNN